ncbi:ATP-dependent DNA helicase [Luteipulveratus halotolerans]|uniref:DNA 3'-5' helicase n=1 Tax=Luteipulveratus halotolerans TaxID=1631356 RepID=A0A0L6CFR3_9MICO|nr:ATP-dependent DNA helicase [Luteipulveratus halotolerans]KNX36534.1 ATP-dependent DNA helicase [Luteipulveratus halotolerans]
MAPSYTALDLATALGNPPPTPEQRAVIEAPLRPLLVVAGAGSGKTETMASRVVWLVANRFVEPDQVLGLTFTRKAAGELAERIGKRLRRLRHEGLWTPTVDDDGTEGLGDIPSVSTYHSYAGRLVGEHGLRLGVEPESRMLSEAAAWQYASEVVQRYDGPMERIEFAESTITAAVVALAGEMAEHLLRPEQVADYLDRVAAHVPTLPVTGRTRGTPPDATAMLARLAARRDLIPLVEAYGALKRRRSALDFSDQMALAAQLAEQFPVLGSLERQRFRAVLLDEFQDTSEAQMVLLKSLFVARGERVPVTAVGDPHQSIYGWRGASATTLSRYPHLFTDADGDAGVLPLSTSWRNDRGVLEVANLTAAPLRAASKVAVEVLHPRPDAGEGTIRAARFETTEAEATHVAEWVRARWFTPEGDRSGRTAAVLCRKRSQFPVVAEALTEAGLPVEIVGIGGLLTTPEVSDLVSLLWVVQDPSRGDRLMRLLTGPALRLGPADLDGLAAWSRHLAARDKPEVPRDQADIAPDSREQASLVEALDELPRPGWAGREGQHVSDVARGRLEGLAAAVRRLRGLTGLPLSDLAGEAERVLGLDIEVLSRPEHTATTARVHLDAFADVAAQFASSADRPTLGGFLAWLDAAEQEERGLDLGYLEVETDAVQVLTVHASKGLEWDVVAVPGLTEGTFPAHDARASWVPDAGDDGEGEWRMGTVKDKGWTSGLDGVPYDLRGDADGLPVLPWHSVEGTQELKDAFVRFHEDGGAHAVAEERRLAYVAFTRARRELLLTAPVWADGKTPRVTSRFVEELRSAGLLTVGEWAPMPVVPEGEKSVPNPRLAVALTATWPHDPLARRREQLADGALRVRRAIAEPPPLEQGLVPVDDRALEIDLLLRERDRARRPHEATVTVPRHLSASAVVALAADPEAFALELRRPMPHPPALAARRGTAFHAWVEQHYAQAALVDITEMPGASDPDADDDADLPAMKAHFLESEWAGRHPDAIEVAVETVVDDIAVRGRIDAVFRSGSDEFTIVDWKTGRPPAGEAARTKVLQLAAYRLAYARLRDVPVEQVDAAFYYAATGETVWPAMPDEDALRELLATIPR